MCISLSPVCVGIFWGSREAYLAVLRAYFWPFTQELLPAVLEEPYAMPEIKARSAVY